MPSSAARRRPGLFEITWPILSENLLHAGAGLLFVWLFAHVSDATAATYGLSNQIMLFFFILFRIIGMGTSVVVTQYLGAGDREGAERIARVSLCAAFWMGLASALITVLFRAPLLDLMDAPPELRPQASAFLALMGWSLALDAISATASSVLRAHTYTRETMRQVLIFHLANICLCVPLVRGWFGLPALGLIGAGIAFLVARVLLVALNLRTWRVRLGLVPRWSDWWRPHWGRLGEILHIGLPGGGENVAYRVCFLLNFSFVAHMGAQALAAHTYILQIAYFILLAGLAIGFGTEIAVGHRIGAGKFRQADRLVNKALRYGMCSAMCCSLCAAVFGRQLMGFFSADPAVIAMGSQVLWLMVLLEPGRTFNLVVINGLRATGDARFPVAFGACSMLCVGVGLAWLLGVHLGWGLLGVWCGFAADEWVRGLAMFGRWRRLAWLPHARRTRHKVRASQSATLTGPFEAE